jgi:hypothetical protein
MSEINDLANLMKDFRRAGKTFVVMLGAGASIKSGVPDTRTMMKEVVERYASGTPGEEIEVRFDKLMKGPSENRRTLLQPYLDKEPSPGYSFLAELIRDGYFETVITFNFDTLLEKALHSTGVHDFATIIRGEIDDVKIKEAAQQPGVKILKLHGSLKGVSNFVFAGEDLVDYPEPIREMVEDLTSRNVLVCGYAYGDQCVISSFSKDGGGNVVIVDPSPPQKLRDVAMKRRSSLVFSGNPGRFDDFFANLHAALTSDRMPALPATKNPFKFLVAYTEEEGNSFFGCEDFLRKVSASLLTNPKSAYFITGQSKVGKTSFVRAGLIPVLPKGSAIYIRCQPGLEKWLPSELEQRYDRKFPPDLDRALNEVASAEGSRTYLILDQFERVARPYDAKPAGVDELKAFLEKLISKTPETITIIYVARTDSATSLLTALMRLKFPYDQMFDIERHTIQIENLIPHLCAMQGVNASLDSAIVERFFELETKGSTDNPFTLAHISAVCHLMCDGGKLDLPTLELVLAEHRDSLDRLINQDDVSGFIEDIPFNEEARALLARMIKVSKEGRRNLAECLKKHFTELFPARVHV